MVGTCLLCHGALTQVLDLGRQPRANGFVTATEVSRDQLFYELRWGFCGSCMMCQTYERPAREIMFNDRYAYYTSANQPMVKHFCAAAENFKRDLDCSFVVEIGSNDGTFLQNFVNEPACDHLGIEPSLNVLNDAVGRGVNSWGTFFNKQVAADIVKARGEASLIYAANVVGHVEQLDEVLRGVAKLLKFDGTFVFEIYYLPSIIDSGSFDLIYDEHIFYFTLNGLKTILQRYDLDLYDCEMLDVHGGSIRGFVQYGGINPYRKKSKRSRLLDMMQREKESGFTTIQPLLGFSDKVRRTKQDLERLVQKLSQEGQVYGYGATAKSTTILNYCDLQIDAIVDSTPCKQGTYSPGMMVPIVPEEQFRIVNPKSTIIFAWNYAEQIMNKQRWYKGNWVLLHPDVRIVK